MVDRFTEVTQRGWGQNVAKSVGGAVAGIVLFFGSFGVLWWNEGRQDMSKVAAFTRPIAAERVDSQAEGKPVSVTGKMVTVETLGDEPYLKAGDYMALNRGVGMYAWVEEKSEETREKIGGGTETITTYNYVKQWTSNPQQAGEFRHPEGHENPYKTIEEKEYRVSTARVGEYNIQPQQIGLPESRVLTIKPDQITPDAGYRLEGNYLFIGKGNLGQPQIGDQRIRYQVVPNNLQVTTFGKLSGDTLFPYLHVGEHKLYRALEGDRELAIATMKTEHRIMTWILRGVGFAAMWFGLMMFFDPILALLGVLPILKQMGKFVLSLITFLVCLVLSLTTILISMIAHNIWVLMVTVVLILAAVVYYFKSRQKKAQAVA